MQKISKESALIKASSWVNQNNHYFPKISMEDNRIEAIEYDAFVFGSSILGKRFMFILQIEEMEESISIGIADIESSIKQNNKYIFYNTEGELYENSEYVTQSKEFQKGDLITVMGDLSESLIIFQINTYNTMIHKSIQMKDKTTKWVPYIYLQLGTSVSIKESFPEIDEVVVYMTESWFKWDEDIVYEVYNCIEMIVLEWKGEDELF